MSPKIWFITGASTGFGRVLTEIVLEKGDSVVATARRPAVLDDLVSNHPSDRLLTLKLDISLPEDVIAAFTAAKDKFGRIDIVVNNAGYGTLGEVEAFGDADARAIFETNFWGTANITKEAVKYMREVNPPGTGGKIFQVSSVAGVLGYAGMAHYSASKFALEGFSEALAGELDPAWNIKISIIEPGGFDTAALSKTWWAPAHPAYSNPALPTAIMRGKWESSKFGVQGDARKAMEVLYKLAALEDPPLHFPLGKDAVEVVRKATTARVADAEKYASWSDNLGKDSQ
ncbi:NAD(P)-binding protein [Polyporus arcularius HHB13444]|uniref:NAD(P)-binding protein n=1 Tax=Polyporus arcularius HHB13444 TaxID=1314778 RepID=A0A5C3PEJ1_9APHY|nr:NAD(P)-binding protein [Polyporus arcularius HHB13444]